MSEEWVIREFNAPLSWVIADGFDTESEAFDFAMANHIDIIDRDALAGHGSGAFIHRAYHDD